MTPMSLVTSEETRPWARTIKMRVVVRGMPPWHMSKTIGIQEFMNDISLSDQQIDTIVRWVDAGAPRGDMKDMRAPKQWPDAERWRISGRAARPAPRSAHQVHALDAAGGRPGPVVPTGGRHGPDRGSLDQGSGGPADAERPRIVHHANTELAEFAVGKIGEFYRDGTAALMKAGSTVTFDIHYHSVGEEVTDYVTVGGWFYPKGYVPKYEIHRMALGIDTARKVLDIPPGKKTVHHAYVVLDQPTRIENFQPQMHFRGTGWAMEAIYPNGRTEMLSYADRFNFNWHVNYVYAEDAAPVLPKGRSCGSRAGMTTPTRRRRIRPETMGRLGQTHRRRHVFRACQCGPPDAGGLGNFQVTDNVLISPTDYDPYCITAPVDARLPNGGGYEVCGLYDIRPAAFPLSRTVVSMAKAFGEQTEVLDGIEVALNARLGTGGPLSGGVSTGRTVTDNCAALVDSPQKQFCRAVRGVLGSDARSKQPTESELLKADRLKVGGFKPGTWD